MGLANSAQRGIPALDFTFGFDDANFSDRILLLEIVENPESAPRVRTIHVSSLILAARSEFFRKLFSNGMRESKQKHATLRIEAFEEVSFMDLLKYIYSNNLPITLNALLDLLVIANKFEVDSCMGDCIRSLQNLSMTLESASRIMDLSSSLVTVEPLIDAAKEFLVAHCKELDKFKDEVLNLPLPGIQAVLSSDDLQVTSEYVVYDLVLRWGRNHYPDVEERREILKTHLLNLVRFPFMTTAELIEKVQTCTDIDPEFASKIAFRALCSKTGTPHLTHFIIGKEGNVASRQFVKRAYKLRHVNEVEFKMPHKHCIVYFDLTREELKNIFPKGRIRSESFHLGGLELYLDAGCSFSTNLGIHHFWLSLNKKGSTTNTIDFKMTLRKKPSMGFQSWAQGSHLPEIMLGKEYGVKWEPFISDDSNWFIDNILHVRVGVTLKV